jgi:hypothetical protein
MQELDFAQDIKCNFLSNQEIEELISVYQHTMPGPWHYQIDNLNDKFCQLWSNMSSWNGERYTDDPVTGYIKKEDGLFIHKTRNCFSVLIEQMKLLKEYAELEKEYSYACDRLRPDWKADDVMQYVDKYKIDVPVGAWLKAKRNKALGED